MLTNRSKLARNSSSATHGVATTSREDGQPAPAGGLALGAIFFVQYSVGEVSIQRISKVRRVTDGVWR